MGVGVIIDDLLDLLLHNFLIPHLNSNLKIDSESQTIALWLVWLAFLFLHVVVYSHGIGWIATEMYGFLGV